MALYRFNTDNTEEFFITIMASLPNLRTVCNELAEIRYKWFQFGVELGIPRSRLELFKKEEDPFSAVVDYWLRGNVEGLPISWQSVVEALESSYVGETGLANYIKKKFCQQGGQYHRKNGTMCS